MLGGKMQADMGKYSGKRAAEFGQAVVFVMP